MFKFVSATINSKSNKRIDRTVDTAKFDMHIVADCCGYHPFKV